MTHQSTANACCHPKTDSPPPVRARELPTRGEELLQALACTLPVGEASRRRAEVGALVQTAERVTETPHGVTLEYAGDDDTARALLDFVLFERRCCAQLTYHLRFAPDHSRVQLEVGGPPELAAAMRAWLAA